MISDMTSDDLTRDQLDKIRESLTPGIRYLNRLIERMEQAWAPNDPLLAKTRKARDELLSLDQDLHYRGCSGVGRPPKT